MSYPVAVVIMPKKEISEYDFFGLILPVVKENFFNRDLSFGSNSQRRGPVQQNQ